MPSLSAGSGTDLDGKGKVEGQKLSDDYTAKHYHRPSDEYDAATWKMDGLLQDLQLYYLTGKNLAYGHTWPEWKAGSEFKTIRDKTKELRK